MSAVVAATAAALTGCGAAADEDDAAAVVDRFHRALAEGDGRAACRLLSPRLESQLPAAGESCAEAVLAKQVPEPGRPVEASVYGTMAQLRYDGDTVFLTELERAGWRIVAAACSEVPGHPYDCRVSAG
ncbi:MULTISPECIES: hypothetical protein [unclassified Nocardioides]|uniref:hypothetical protein n=1 Tax=unclassified Nocardioides TaxID=2615069 RepID=UPI0026668A47|nr:hypothetical protein [Nocardioides sp. Arc9.136]WKN50203.1 hypothetical protein OSR43_08765 [Nocardioides sp. Arc9.136]